MLFVGVVTALLLASPAPGRQARAAAPTAAELPEHALAAPVLAVLIWIAVGLALSAVLARFVWA
jgi:hypothetical protein